MTEPVRTPDIKFINAASKATIDTVRNLLPERIQLIKDTIHKQEITAADSDLETKLLEFMGEEKLADFIQEIRTLNSKIPTFLDSFKEDEGVLILKTSGFSTHRFDNYDNRDYVEVNIEDIGGGKNTLGHELAHYYDFDFEASDENGSSLCPQHVWISKSKDFTELTNLLRAEYPDYAKDLEEILKKKVYFWEMNYELFACLAEDYLKHDNHPPEVVKFFTELGDESPDV